MLDTKKLDDRYSVAAQLRPEDMQEVAALGFKTVINHRPDGEAPDQPEAETCRAAAEACGLEYIHIPMTSATLGEDLLERFHGALETAPAPVLAHCRSGTRSTVLWALVETCYNGGGIDDVMERAARQGYDLSGTRPLIAHFAAKHAESSA